MRNLIIFSFLICNLTVFGQKDIPHLNKKGSTTQLIVYDQPYLILGGELGNSSSSDMDYMESFWPKLKAMNLNTVLVPVYWELIEKEEGKYDFTLVDDLIEEARNNDLKLIFLWFASWKNSMSCYAPGWVKTNQKKYPRAKEENGVSQEILTPFSDNNLRADLKAFEKLMQQIKEIDSKDHTVIMIQVENEIGMLPSARDHHALANKAFADDVPKDLINYMNKNKDILVPELISTWEENGSKTKGNWEEIFGKSLATDEMFMAWYFSEYTNKIIEAGKKIYPLPMFVNAALNRPSRKPGEYPSAGPLPHVMDIWKAAGPTIDFLSPDFYNPRFKHWNDLYTRQGDPLFIPEHRFDETAAAKALYAIGHYEGMGFSPFSIESTDNPQDEPLGKMYGIIEQMIDLITQHHGEGKMDAVLFDKENQETIIELGNYEFTFRHDYTLGWSPGANEDTWPMTSAIIIQTGENEYFVAGSGVVVTFKVKGKPTLNAGILRIDEGNFENGSWKPGRRLNGDQSHQGRHLRIPAGNFDIQKLELYTYE